MSPQFIDLTRENLSQQHLCCIIRSKTQHPGVEAKRRWLAERLEEGHVFRKLDAKATVFIEYAPLETAWVPIVGENYLYIYCLWVLGEAKGKGYGRALMESCLSDAKRQGKSGICMLGFAKQKAWLSDQSFAKRFGFETVDRTDNGYELLALSLDGSTPRFAQMPKKCISGNREYPFTTMTSVPMRYSRSCGSNNMRRNNRYPSICITSPAGNRQKPCPASLTTGRSLSMEILKRSTFWMPVPLTGYGTRV